jgi:hypothetical protein
MISKKTSTKSGGGAGALIDYITDEQDNDLRVGSIAYTNFINSQVNKAEAIQEIYAVQKKAREASKEREKKPELMYHMIISFAPGENPSEQILIAAEAALVESIGLQAHQRVSVVHHDTDCVHIHVAINKVNPVSGRVITPYQCKQKRSDACVLFEKVHGLINTNHTSRRDRERGIAENVEANSGVESLISYARRTVAGQLENAQSWKEAHAICAENGLSIKQRGAGYIIQATDGTTIKASNAARSLGKKQLDAQLGEFTAAELAEIKESRRYDKRPLGTAPNRALYSQYQTEQAANKTAKLEGLAALKTIAANEYAAILKTHQSRRSMIKLAGNTPAAKYLYKQASESRQKAIENHKADIRLKRTAIMQSNPSHTWADWLHEKAQHGNADALIALRARKHAPLTVKPHVFAPGARRPMPKVGTKPPPRSKGRMPAYSELGFMQVGPKPVEFAVSGQGKAGVSKQFDASITKGGSVIYKSNNGTITDKNGRLHVTAGADLATITQTLKIARERYGDKLAISGTDQFKAQALQVAIAQRLPITFADPTLEAKRRAATQPGKSNEHRNGYGNSPEHGRTRPNGPDAIRARAAADASGGHEQPNAEFVAPRAATGKTDSLRNLPEFNVVHNTNDSDVLLPRHVPADMGKHQPAGIDELRRHLSEQRGIRPAALAQADAGLAGFIVSARNRAKAALGDAPTFAMFDGKGPGIAQFKGAFPNEKAGAGYALFEASGITSVMPLTLFEANAMKATMQRDAVYNTWDVHLALRGGGESNEPENNVSTDSIDLSHGGAALL